LTKSKGKIRKKKVWERGKGKRGERANDQIIVKEWSKGKKYMQEGLAWALLS
jgi:hypothetical protein